VGRKNPAKNVPAAAATAGRPKLAPRVQETVDFSGSHPTWSFANLDLYGPFGWSLLAAEMLEQLLDRLRAWESMTWHQIKMEGRKRNHSIKVADCSKLAQQRLVEIKLDDVEDLFSLGVQGKPRVVGILDRNVFKFLWWDPEHLVCPSELKHT
jgi:hypothetical protein